MNKKMLLSISLFLLSIVCPAQKRVSATSPDGQTQVNITLSDKIYYDVVSHGETLFEKSHLGLKLSDRTLGEKPVLKGKKIKEVNETLTPIQPLKVR